MAQTAHLDMTSYCFDIILGRLSNRGIPVCPPSIPNDKYPLFVTWKRASNNRLRGCIGTFSRDLSLHEGLFEYAQNSAFHDSRFEPIALSEIPSLSCSVSLLVNFEPANNYRDWIIGVHGIRIECKQNGRRLNAVYLPEVASEQQWDHIETMNNLMKKGGFHGAITEADRMRVVVERFQSEKVSLTFDEYVSHKRRKGEIVSLAGLNGFH